MLADRIPFFPEPSQRLAIDQGIGTGVQQYFRFHGDEAGSGGRQPLLNFTL